MKLVKYALISYEYINEKDVFVIYQNRRMKWYFGQNGGKNVINSKLQVIKNNCLKELKINCS